MRVGLITALLCFGACEPKRATEVPDTAATAVLSLQDIDCSSCGEDLATALANQTGVYDASFNRKLAELTVRYDQQQAAPEQFASLVDAEGYVAVAGPGQGRYLPEVEFDAAWDVVKIADAGQRVQLEPHLAAGKVTVFDFYAPWCKPCREVDHHMKDVLATQPDVALRKLDIVDWDSELAKAYLGSVENLPYVIVYGRSGKRIAAISGLDLAGLDAAVDKGRRR
ncbi:MAG: thioredoxin family protein [Myxococcota bacterium]